MSFDAEGIARTCGFEHFNTADASILHTNHEVRNMCAADRCRAYDRNWSCPPACGELDEFDRAFRNYRQCLVVQTTCELNSPFDWKTMQDAQAKHNERFAEFAQLVKDQDNSAMFLAAGACVVCPECAYPDPCRFPDKRFISMEAAGLIVNQVCTDAGLGYNYGEQTVTYSSCVLFN